MVAEGWDLELEAEADAEVRRRMAPPYRPAWDLIACRACGRRIYTDDGRPLHRWWWHWWPTPRSRWG